MTLFSLNICLSSSFVISIPRLLRLNINEFLKTNLIRISFDNSANISDFNKSIHPLTLQIPLILVNFRAQVSYPQGFVLPSVFMQDTLMFNRERDNNLEVVDMMFIAIDSFQRKKSSLKEIIQVS